MRYTAAIDSEPKLAAPVDAAQDEPVFITESKLSELLNNA